MLALTVEAGRKDRLPHLLATISVGIKRNRFSFTDTRCRAVLVACLTGFAATEPLSNQKECQTRAKCFGNPKPHVDNNKPIFLIDLTVDNNSKPLIFLILAKGTQHNKHIRVCSSNRILYGWQFGLTKVLLAEGDAPFPFVRHRHISLRRSLLLRKIMMLAQRDRENSRKKTKVAN